MFPATAEVIRVLRPRAFIVENVKGLTRTAFANYFAYIQLRLALPDLVPHEDEKWTDHLQRLQSEFTSTSDSGLTYKAITTLVDAADYGVPQRRHRVFMIGFRSDVDAEWAFPEPTHSRGALLYDQWVSGEYWDRHRVALKDRPEAPVTAHKSWRAPDAGYRPWRTVRDALEGMREPSPTGSRKYLNHLLQPGARSYPGHTGSPLDHPAKTLKSGVHGVPGGENMLRRPDGSVRYFSVREAARLQTFPDRYELHGAWSEAMRQLGNAVPVMLAEKVAGSVARHLELAGVRARQSGMAAKRASA